MGDRHEEQLELIIRRIDEQAAEDKEFREALLGTYEKKGLISRVRSIEKYISIQWGVISVVGIAVLKDFVLNLL